MCYALLEPYAVCRNEIINELKSSEPYLTAKNKNAFLFKNVMEKCATSRGLFMSCLYRECQSNKMYSEEWHKCLNRHKLIYEEKYTKNK